MSKKKTNDITLKIFALLIAIFLWSYVMNEVNPVIEKEIRNIDLEFSNAEALSREGLKVIDPQEAKVSVRISGKKNDMDKFSSDSIKALVDLSGYREGQMKIPVKVSLENEMSNIKIIDYEPKEVLVTFDKFVTLEKEITIRTVGELPEGYVVGDIGIKPSTVLLKGPRSYIKEVAEVVAFIDLDGKTSSQKLNAQIRLLDSQGNDLIGIEKDPGNVDINLEILRSKSIPININLNKNLPDDYELKNLSLTPNKLRVKGDDEILKIKSIDTMPIDVDMLLSKKKLEVKLNLPDNISPLNPEEKIFVSLHESEMIEKTLSYKIEDIEMLNIKDNLKVEDDKNINIDIILKGDKVKLDNVGKNDLNLHLDLTDLDPGTYTLDLKYSLPEGIKVKQVTPESIRVKISEG